MYELLCKSRELLRVGEVERGQGGERDEQPAPPREQGGSSRRYLDAARADSCRWSVQ